MAEDGAVGHGHESRQAERSAGQGRHPLLPFTLCTARRGGREIARGWGVPAVGTACMLVVCFGGHHAPTLHAPHVAVSCVT